MLLTLLVALLVGMAALRPAPAAAGGWSAQTSGVTSTLRDVSATGPGQVWLCGNYDYILNTSNGGSIWNIQYGAPTYMDTAYAIDFIDSSHGWFGANGGRVYETTDGGATWDDAGGPGWEAQINNIDFVDADHGWAVGPGSAIAATSDGGGSWTTQNPGVGSYLLALYFRDASHGWVGGGNGYIGTTSNGGATWTTQLTGSQTYYDITFTDADHGWAVGYNGVIAATTNGGASWSFQTSGTTATLQGVAFTDNTHGWAVGDSGTLLRTTNGGATWTAQTSGTTQQLLGVGFADAAHGWAVGTNGTIIAYTAAAPTVNISGGDIAWHGSAVDLTVTATVDPDLTLSALEYSTDGGSSWTEISGSGSTRTLTIDAEGMNVVLVRATDSGTQTATDSAIVKIDLTDPATTATGLQADTHSGWIDGPQLVTLSAGDALSGVAATSYRIDGGALKTYTGAFSVSGTGSHTVRYYSTDNAGNVETAHVGYVNIKGDASALLPAWRWQNPEPTGMALAGVDFADASHGWAVGYDGTILATSDGGATWTPQIVDATSYLQDVAFADASTGWTVGYSGTILKTTDGGSSWISQESGVTGDLYDVCFADAQHGWVVGVGGTILATTDGGATWSAQSSGTTNTLQGASFVDASHGWVVGASGTILVTTDGGANWSTQSSTTIQPLTGVDFVNATTGWAVGWDGTILATTDGGATWGAQSSGSNAMLSDVECVDADHGWVIDVYGAVYTTTNGGATWIEEDPTSYIGALAAITFADATHGCAVGFNGLILTTSDGGANWDLRTTSAFDLTALNDIAFVDASHGWTVGQEGVIAATGDGGENWSYQDSGTTAYLEGVKFVSTTRGWVVGGNGTILRTTDGGTSWSTQTSGSTAYLNAVAFVDSTHGWAVGLSGTVLRTTDGGATWGAQNPGTTQGLQAVDFVSTTTGWAVGNNGVIRRTTDGGATWSAQSSGTTEYLYGVDFVDGQTGWAVGSSGTILTTTDGGATWSAQTSGTTSGLNDVVFNGSSHGWAVGGGTTILATTDGGATWSEQRSNAAAQLNGVAFVDEKNGWVAGGQGNILATEIGGAIDTTDPSAVGGLASGTHPDPDTWYADNDPSFGWDAASDDGSGIAGYSWAIDQTADTIPDTTVDGEATSASFSDLPSGVYYFHIRAVDNLGNGGPTTHYTVRIDTTPPVTTDDAPSGVQSGPVTVHFDANDAHSGVAHTYYTVNGGLAQEGASVVVSDVGTTQLTYWSVDAVGNTESPNSASVEIDAALAGTLAINNGANVTATTRVVLHSSVEGATEMRFSNDGSTWSEWETYSGLAVWTLASGSGEKTVSAEYRDAGSGNLATSDTITLDAGYPSGTMQINGGASSTADLAVTLVNDVSGATEMRFRDAGGTWSEWEAFAATKAWTLPSGGEAAKTVEAEFRDAELDVLASSDAIIVDATAPTGMMQIEAGATYAGATAVTLANDVTGATEMRFRDAGGAWSEWEAFAATKAWTLPSGDGLKLVEAQYRDAEADVLQAPDTILVDTEGPAAPSEVSASWIRLAGNSGRVSVTYQASEATQISPLVVTVTVKTGSGITKATATYSGESLDTVITHTIATTLTKGTYRVTFSMADAAGNTAAGVATVVMAVN